MSPRNLELVVNDRANCNLVVNADTEKYLVEIRQANGDKPDVGPKKRLKPHVRNRHVVSTFTVKEKEQLKISARKQNLSVSELIRKSLAGYFMPEEGGNQEYKNRENVREIKGAPVHIKTERLFARLIGFALGNRHHFVDKRVKARTVRNVWGGIEDNGIFITTPVFNMFCEMYRIQPLKTIHDLYEKGYIKSKVSENSATAKRRGFYSYQYRKTGINLYGYYILIPEICRWQAEAEVRLLAA